MDMGVNTPQYNVRLQSEWSRIERMRARVKQRMGEGIQPDMRARARVYYHPESITNLPAEEFKAQHEIQTVARRTPTLSV
jgi:hypothetical protein